MTTVAFKDNEICVDSYLTQGEVISDYDANKVKKIRGVIFVFAGSLDGEESLIKAYFGDKHDGKVNTNAFVIEGGKVVEIGISEGVGFWKNPLTKHDALGSGSYFAMGAMDAGCSAYDAVKIAINRDVYSGGRIRRIKVKK